MDNKKIAVVGVSALALGLGVTNVHAEEVTIVAPTTNHQTVSKKETKPEVKKEVTKGQVDVAKDKLDKSTQAVEDAQAKKSQAQTEKDQAQTEVGNAQSEVDNAQQAKDKATPENIENQNQEVTDAEKGKTDAEKQEKNAEKDLAKAKDVVADQEKVVNKSEKKVVDAENEVKDAQNDVDNAKAILDGTGKAKVVEEKENAETAQKQAQKQVTSAEEVLEQAKSDDKNLEDAISSVQNELAEASKVVASTESTLTDTTSKAERTQTALEKAQDAFALAEASYKSINTFQVTDEYVNSLKSYVNNPYDILHEPAKWEEHRKKVESILESVNQENLNLNKFKGNANDKAINVDANNLTTEQMTELSLFASDLLNQIRERFGTPKTVVTKGMLQVADEVTDGYVADVWGFGKGHDSKVVNNVARKYGLPTYEDDTHQYLENLSSINSGDEIHTMYDAKKWVYKSISNLLFNGWEWLHAQSITGLISQRANKEYFALGLSSSTGRTSAHFFTVSDKQVTGNKLDKTEVPNNNTVESIVKAYNTANSALLNAQTVNSQAQREKTSASLANIKAKGEQETIQKRLDALKATPLKTPTAQSKLEQAQDILANANTRLKNANKALDALTADVKLKQENLDKAKEVLAQKETTLKEKVTALKEAEANLDKLLKEQKIDQEAYDKLFALYSEQVEAKRLADLETQKQAIISSGETPIEVYDETGKLVSYQVKPKTVSQSPVSYNDAWNKKQESSLPNTGTSASMLPVVGMILGLLSLVGLRKSKEN